MNNRSKQYTELEPGTAQWVQNKTYELKAIPEPGESWKFRDVDISLSTHRELIDKGLIKRLDRERGSKLYSYETRVKAYHAIQYYLAQKEGNDGILPCGHNGFVNQGNSLECKRCGSTHDKSEVSA